MKKLLITINLLLFAILLFSQEEESHIFLMESSNGYMYIDNSPGVYLTIDIDCDSLKQIEGMNAFLADDKFLQVMKFKYDPAKYNNGNDTEREIELLQFYKDYEVDYLKKEVFKTEIEIKEEIFLNSHEKRFYLWSYKMPEIDSISEVSDLTTHQLFLTFVCNEHVCGINIPVHSSEDFSKVKKNIVSISEGVNVFGASIDFGALYYKIDALKKNTAFQLFDSLRNYKFDIPEWLNTLDDGSDYLWMASLPDFNNVKNVISVQWFEKEGFKSFKKFNEEKVAGKKVADEAGLGQWVLKKELKTPKGCNGVAYKANVLYGKTIYHNQYVTFESKSAFFLVVFTATEETYEKNLVKFDEFLKGFNVILE